MSKPPKLSLAAIVAAATPPAQPRGAKVRAAEAQAGEIPGARSSPRIQGRRPAARAQGAEIVALVPPAPVPRPAATLKQRARQMSVYLEPPVYDQLRDLAYAERTKMHALILEGLDLLFRQRGARSIAQLSDPPPR